MNPNPKRSIEKISKEDGADVIDSKDICNKLGKHFAQASTMCENQLPNAPPPDIRTNMRMRNFTIDELGVSKIISSLSIKKAVGPDNISNRVIKLIQPSLSYILPFLFNKSLTVAQFPSNWKLSNVIPIYKGKGSKHSKNSYRPISLTSCISKIFEMCVLNHLQKYLISDSKWICANQSGFRKGDSTTFQLIKIIDDLAKGIESKKYMRFVFLDIEKAFDRAWHKSILNKLRQAGVTENLVKWIESYLTARKIRITLDGFESAWYIINAGVPQGSVLVPLLFLVFINDLSSNITNTVNMFADDTSLYGAFPSLSTEDSRTLQNDLNGISEWANKNMVRFNPSKIVEVVYTNRPIVNHSQLYFNGSPIKVQKRYKHLGLTLQDNLKWDIQISDKTQAMMALINMLKTFKWKLGRTVLEKYYLTFVRPLCEYTMPFLGYLPVHHRDSLVKVQYEATLLVTGLQEARHITSS